MFAPITRSMTFTLGLCSAALCPDLLAEQEPGRTLELGATDRDRPRFGQHYRKHRVVHHRRHEYCDALEPVDQGNAAIGVRGHSPANGRFQTRHAVRSHEPDHRRGSSAQRF